MINKLTPNTFIKPNSNWISKSEMIARGADGFLTRAKELYIPLDKITGLEPIPGDSDDNIGYAKQRPIRIPIEVAYDSDNDCYILYGGNHRVHQARLNGDKTILAFVEPDNGLTGPSNLIKENNTNINNNTTFKEIPEEPGTTPIRPGFVRLYHQTTAANLKQIEKTGLLIQHALGIEGPRAIYAGKTGFYGSPESRPTLEFQVPVDRFLDPFVLDDVMPENFIAAHYPWHRHARYLENGDGSRGLIDRTLKGDFDRLDGDYTEAVKYIKQKYGNK